MSPGGRCEEAVMTYVGNSPKHMPRID